MIAELMRAFVEAVIVRELAPQLPPGARCEGVKLVGELLGDDSYILYDWSYP